jgi:hypothetical protein
MGNVSPNGAVTVSREVADADTYLYLVTFPESMGDVPQMSVVSELTPGGATVVVTNVVEGNVISGSFRMSVNDQTTVDIASDASANDVRLALEALSSIESVVVTRSSVTFQHGYSWTVEFNGDMNDGNVNTLIPDYSGLTITSAQEGATAFINVTSRDGNEVGGDFVLTLDHGGQVESTDPIAFDATAEAFKEALESMPNNIIPPGTIAVSRTGPDGERGYSWTVTFLSDYARTFEGDLNLRCRRLDWLPSQRNRHRGA